MWEFTHRQEWDDSKNRNPVQSAHKQHVQKLRTGIKGMEVAHRVRIKPDRDKISEEW